MKERVTAEKQQIEERKREEAKRAKTPQDEILQIEEALAKNPKN